MKKKVIKCEHIKDSIYKYTFDDLSYLVMNVVTLEKTYFDENIKKTVMGHIGKKNTIKIENYTKQYNEYVGKVNEMCNKNNITGGMWPALYAQRYKFDNGDFAISSINEYFYMHELTFYDKDYKWHNNDGPAWVRFFEDGPFDVYYVSGSCCEYEDWEKITQGKMNPEGTWFLYGIDEIKMET